MEKRVDRCGWCRMELVVPPGTREFRCAVCHGINRVQPHDLMSHAASRYNSFMNSSGAPPFNNSNSSWGTLGYGYHPQPPRPQPPVATDSAHGKKKAVLCGICYHGKSYRLKGPINDVKCMRYFLIQKMAFPVDSILMLTEEERNPLMVPTKYNIRMALTWLIQGCQEGDSLVFYFSGHGTQEFNLARDEVDGFDEALCPVDFETEGKILDDEMNATIVRPLPHGAKLHAIVDACHSGTVLDLPFLCRMNRAGYYTWEDHRINPYGGYKGTRGGLAISISSCDDYQTSVDTSALSGNTVTGALTYSFIQAAQNEPGLTYGRLLTAMRRRIGETRAGTVTLSGGAVASMINRALGTRLSQEPQLSSSDIFDVYSKQFGL